jgi:hypothetical protein
VSEAEAATGVRYVAAYKSGATPFSYDANFYSGSSGFTSFLVSESGGGFELSQTFLGENVSRFYRTAGDAVGRRGLLRPGLVALEAGRVALCHGTRVQLLLLLCSVLVLPRASPRARLHAAAAEGARRRDADIQRTHRYRCGRVARKNRGDSVHVIHEVFE